MTRPSIDQESAAKKHRLCPLFPIASFAIVAAAARGVTWLAPLVMLPELQTY
jgi:hypothetical protein